MVSPNCDYAKLSTTNYFKGFKDMRRQCTKKYPNIDFCMFEMDDETASMVSGGEEDHTDDATSKAPLQPTVLLQGQSSDHVVEPSSVEDQSKDDQSKDTPAQT